MTTAVLIPEKNPERRTTTVNPEQNIKEKRTL
jgi:hypothetical protein